MNTASLSKVCRCGHPRRFHRQGTIWEAYDTGCTQFHAGEASPVEYRDAGYCGYFEVADGWADSYAKALRAEGYMVIRASRDERGQFVSPEPIS